jgi:Type II secretion system (T2SS), protein K
MREQPKAPLRSSVLVMVLITLVFTAAALTAFIEKAGNDLMVEVHRSDAMRLRQEAFSAIEVTLAVLEDFREADNGLHSTAEGWGDPLTWANWSPSPGRTVDISFRDESGKIPLAHADLTTLTNLFEEWQLAPADAEKLADALEGWMVKGYSYTTTLTPDYTDAPVPYTEPARPMRSFMELAAVDDAKEFFFDENGQPNGNYWRFVDDCSLFNFPQPNANGANPDVMAAVGQYTDIQRQHIGDFLNGTGQYSADGQQWLQNPAQLAAVAGLGGNATTFGTTISALRINVTVHDGRSQYRVSVVVAPQGGATTNQTIATNATAAASTTSTASTTSITATAQPSSTANSATAAAAASQSINYPFTLLEILEDDDIPQSPPALPQT